ncbi:MAG: hypothetical protein UT57_C0039G0002 [Microgenomates group bacterium GW2011_GWC1_39_7]|nr:MAG: hypothetical protein UT57_C0039G0002 [Microgenomates group bacterium GW2011_GWC1_39_7]
MWKYSANNVNKMVGVGDKKGGVEIMGIIVRHYPPTNQAVWSKNPLFSSIIYNPRYTHP